MFEVPASTSAPTAASYFEALVASTVLQLSPNRFLRAETTPVPGAASCHVAFPASPFPRVSELPLASRETPRAMRLPKSSGA